MNGPDNGKKVCLRAPQWMQEAVRLNPAYTWWRPGQDAMPGRQSTDPWSQAGEYANWEEFAKDWGGGLDECNHCVHFHFDLVEGETPDLDRLDLVLWIIHPRKGASKGVVVQGLRQGDVKLAAAWLREAAGKNAMIFSKLPVMR